MINKIKIGRIGETYFQIELLKHDIPYVYIGNHNINHFPDFMFFKEGKIFKVECKTSVYKPNAFLKKVIWKGGYSFARLQKSSADYYVFALLNEDLTLYKIFAVDANTYKSDTLSYYRPDNTQEIGRRGSPQRESDRDYFLKLDDIF